MFKITATNNGKTTEMVFPCSEIELKARLIFIGATEGYPAQVTVAKVHSRPELEVLEGRICDPDELNYLAKRLESFTSLEYAQFCEGIKSGGFTKPKDLINLTYNLDKYVLIQHIPSYEAIGRSYLLNSQGCLPVGEDDSKYEQVGREIISSGKGVFTDHGLLFVSDKPMEEVYDGVSFPAYDYKGNAKYELSIAFGGHETIMFLPAEEIAITKAITRLGARFDRECDITLTGCEDNPEISFLQNIIENDGIQAANRLIELMTECDLEIAKLRMIAESANVESALNLSTLADHYQLFTYVPDVKDETALGEYYFKGVKGYVLDDDMEIFFDFESYGQYIADKLGGKFVSDGYVYCDNPYDFDHVMAELQPEVCEDMDMNDQGGM